MQDSQKCSRLAGIFMLLVFIVPMAVYLRTICPTVTAGDGGELLSAAVLLGIAHPPGYPLWTLLGYMFSFLPAGELAFRVNMVSAFFAASTVLIVYLILRLAGLKNYFIAAGAALIFAFSRTLWSQAVISKGLYALNAFFVASTLYLLLLWRRDLSKKWLFLMSFVYGLSLANHNTMALLGPVYLVCALYIGWKCGWLTTLKPSDYIKIFLFFAAGISVYFYMLFRAQAKPAMNWGNPENLGALIDHITRRQYGKLGGVPRSPVVLFQDIGVYLGFFWREFTPWLVVLVPVGLWRVFRRDKNLFGITLTMFLVLTFVFCFVLSFKTDELNREINSVFFTPSYLIAALWIAEALAWVAGLWKILFFPASVLFIVPLFLNYFTNDWSRNYLGRDYGRNILSSVEKNAVLFTGAYDNESFIPLYLSKVEKYRSDISMWSDAGYIMGDIYGPDFPKFGQIDKDKILTDIQMKIVKKAEKPVYFVLGGHLVNLPGVESEHAGILFRVKNPANKPISNEEIWKQYRFRGLDENISMDFLTRDISTHYHFFMAEKNMLEGNREKALEECSKAVRTGASTQWLGNELGKFYARWNMVDEAFALASKLESSGLPSSKLRFHLGLYYYGKKDLEKSIEQYLMAVKSDPDDYWAWSNMSIAYMDIRMFNEALSAAQNAVKANPEFADAWAVMGNVYFNLRDFDSAVRSWTRAVALDPNQTSALSNLQAVKQMMQK